MAIAAKGAGKGAAKGGKGRGGRGRGGRGGGALSIPQLALQQSQQQVSASEQPILDQIAQEKAANLARAQAQIGFSKAAAALMQNAAPAVQSAYSNAANADAGYAKGLGSGVQSQLDQSQNANNAFLSQMGTPQSALHAAPAVGDVAYGLQGYIPASALQQEGAGWESAAQLAPGNLLAAGQQQAAGMMNPANDSTLKTLNEDLAKLAATQPEVYQKLLTAYNDQAYKQAEIGLAAGRLKQGQQRLNLDAQLGFGRLAQGQQRIGIESQRLNIEAQRAVQSNRQAWARIGIEDKRLQLEITKQAMAAKGGGLSATTMAEKTAEAQSWAQRILGDTQDPTTGKPMPQLSVPDAVTEALKSGIPLSIVIPEFVKTMKAENAPPASIKAFQKQYAPLLNSINKAAQKVNWGGLQGTPFGAAGNALETKAGGMIVNMARHFIGTPYVWGGESPKGFDCSGFAQYLYGKAGISIPRTTYTQWTAPNGHSVPFNQLTPGDLVFFRGSDSRGGLPGHVGVYIGNDMMIDAPHTGADVRIEKVSTFGGYMGARRFG